MQYLLVIFGWFAVITSILIVLIPYLRGRRDLINVWTLFQVSCANFLGLASIESGSAFTHLYTTPRDEDYVKYFMGGVVFYLVAILTYYFFRFPQRLGERRMRKVGPRTPGVMLRLLPVCFLLTLGYLYVPQVQFLGQWMMIVGRAAGMLAVAFCLTSWAQRPYNVWLAVLSGIFLLIGVLAAGTEFGRRDMLAALITVPICWYWLRGRYLNPVRVMGMGTIFGVVAFVGISGYTIVRFARANPDLGIVEAAWEKLKAVPDAFNKPGSTEGVFGSDCAEASLAAIRLYDLKAPEPFFALKYIALHPIPRAWWPDKPQGLGYTLPFDIGWFQMHPGYVNLGPGVIGHAYQEGGLFFAAFYAFLFASCARFFDALIAKDPTNPYLLGSLGAASGQIIALIRGDIGLFSVMIIGAFIAGVFMSYLARFFFWTEYLPTPEEAAQIPAPNEYGWDHAQPAEGWQ